MCRKHKCAGGPFRHPASQDTRTSLCIAACAGAAAPQQKSTTDKIRPVHFDTFNSRSRHPASRGISASLYVMRTTFCWGSFYSPQSKGLLQIKALHLGGWIDGNSDRFIGV